MVSQPPPPPVAVRVCERERDEQEEEKEVVVGMEKRMVQAKPEGQAKDGVNLTPN